MIILFHDQVEIRNNFGHDSRHASPVVLMVLHQNCCVFNRERGQGEQCCGRSWDCLLEQVDTAGNKQGRTQGRKIAFFI